jgi:hypothetical protein
MHDCRRRTVRQDAAGRALAGGSIMLRSIESLDNRGVPASQTCSEVRWWIWEEAIFI